MKWLGVQSILALIAAGVESKCGEFSPSKIVLEEPAIIVETRLGEPLALALKLPDHNYTTSVLTAPNGRDYPLDNLDKTKDTYEYVINESNISATKDILVLRILDNEREQYRISYNTLKKELDNREEQKEECKRTKTENELDENKIVKELVLGPITEDYFGNWMITACYVNAAGRETEVFKVVSIHIEEPIKTVPPDSTVIRLHQDLFLRLDRSIPDLQSCELMGPPGTGDRAFERDPEHLDSCGFLLRNVGVHDLGSWKVVAVGRAVYVGTLDVNI